MTWTMQWWRSFSHQALATRRPPLSVGPVALDVAGRRVMIQGSVVHLPGREAAILEVLMRHASQVVSHHELGAAIGQRHHRDDHLARWVRRLSRRLMVTPLLPPLIETIDSAGYRYTSIERCDGMKS